MSALFQSEAKVGMCDNCGAPDENLAYGEYMGLPEWWCDDCGISTSEESAHYRVPRQTFTKSGGVMRVFDTAFTLDLSRADSPHIALFQLANQLEQCTGYWLDFREQPNGLVTEWMLMDSRGVAHKAIGTPRTVTIPLASRVGNDDNGVNQPINTRR